MGQFGPFWYSNLGEYSLCCKVGIVDGVFTVVLADDPEEDQSDVFCHFLGEEGVLFHLFVEKTDELEDLFGAVYVGEDQEVGDQVHQD